jgi:hypothetical protein
MRRTWYRVGLLFCMFLFGFGLLPFVSRANSGTPTPVESLYPPEFCTPAEIAAMHSDDPESPLESPSVDALVSPASVPGMDLYVVKVTVPPHACVAFTGHFLHDGAVVWLVDSGKVTFDFQLIKNRPVPDLVYQPREGARQPVSPMLQLDAGDWVSTDRAVHYSYLNTEATPAVIIMTVLEKRWIYTGSEIDPILMAATECKGVCRNPRR